MCHVLVIEDEALVAMLIEDTLVAQGAASVDIAMTEADAIEAARLHRPDFITSDVRLFEGTGPQAVAAIQAAHGDIPVLYITASPHECGGCPSDSILRKPVDFEEVKRRYRVVQTEVDGAA